MDKLVFQENDTIGSVIYVDTNQVLIEVEDNEKISLLNVGSIVAIQTTRAFEFTIGIIDKVRRKANELMELEDLTDEYNENLEEAYISCNPSFVNWDIQNG